MHIRFEPIAGKCGEIIEALMASEDMPCDESILFKIRLCIEEAAENVVRYAYEGGKGWIEVGTEQEGDALVISMTDAGVAFNPLDKPDPDLTLSVEDRPIGGLGIFLCKKLMDSVEYSREGGLNCLKMKIKIN